MEEGSLVLCIVEKIEKTTVFVKLEEGKEGTIVTSEIAPGRIRNLRDYVIPGKRIVCKILEIDNQGNIHLSLRRVSSKEKKEVLERYEKEKSSISILKSVLKDKAEDITKKISMQGSLYDFLQLCKLNPEKLEKFMTKEEATRVCKILKEKKEKKVEVKKEFFLSTNKENGISIIKKILLPYKNITYLAAGKYLIKVKAQDYKKANLELQKILGEI